MIIKGTISKTVKDKLIIIDDNGRVLVGPEHFPDWLVIKNEGDRIDIVCYYHYFNKGYYPVYHKNMAVVGMTVGDNWEKEIAVEELESLKYYLIAMGELFPTDPISQDKDFGNEIRKLINNKLKTDERNNS